MQLPNNFFNHSARQVARKLLGKVIRRKTAGKWLSARIIETEAYYLDEKASHASLGYTEKRKALFMPAGTIYMYYARGKDSLNISCKGEGNAVLIKSAHYFHDCFCSDDALNIMQQLNPAATGELRPTDKLCSGQTLLCKALDIKLTDWDQQTFKADALFIDDIHYSPEKIIQTTRLGIPQGRDEDLMLRYIDAEYAQFCTKNPLKQKSATYRILDIPDN